MNSYTLSHLSDPVLLRNLTAVVARERTATAEVLAHIAEVDARKLYLPAAYPSMFLYCVHELHLCEQAAFKRIFAARTARQFPAIFTALAKGQLHLSAVVLLAPHLIPETVDELLATAVHKSKSEIEKLLAERFPRPDVPARIQPLALSPAPGTDRLSPGKVEQPDPDPVEPSAPGRIEEPDPRPKVKPLAPERFAVQFTIGKDTPDMLQYAQALLGHAIPSGDIATVFHRVLQLAIPELERQKFAATEKPQRSSRRSSPNARHIPALVKRTVWQRDQGRCTFISERGQRCPSRKFLEFDHVDPVARGGQATVERMQLRCRAHNKAGFFPGWRGSDEMGQAPGDARHAGKNLLN